LTDGKPWTDGKPLTAGKTLDVLENYG